MSAAARGFQGSAGPAGVAAGLCFAFGLLAAVQAPEGHGAVAWAGAQSALLVAGVTIVGLRRGARASAVFAGGVLAFAPAVGLAALVTMRQRMTSDPHELGCGLGITMLALMAMPIGTIALASFGVATGSLFARERPALERVVGRFAAVACAACLVLAGWAAFRAEKPPTLREWLATLQQRGAAGPLRLAPVDRRAAPEKRVQDVQEVGVVLHRSCSPPNVEALEVGGSCFVALGEGADPERPWHVRWAGPVSALDALDVRFDERNDAWIVSTGDRAFAFRDGSMAATTLTLGDAMSGPPRAFGLLAALGIGISAIALAWRRRRGRDLLDIDRAAEGSLAGGWIHLDDGRTVRAPADLSGADRVLVLSKSAAPAPYRDPETALAILRGDRAENAASVRAARAAAALVALAAAALASMPLLAALV